MCTRHRTGRGRGGTRPEIREAEVGDGKEVVDVECDEGRIVDVGGGASLYAPWSAHKFAARNWLRRGRSLDDSQVS